MNAILGGHIDLTDGNLTQRGKVEAGQLKFLAIATEKRDPEIPTVPTLKELGVNVVYAVSRGITVPKGTPADVLAKLEGACAQEAANDPAFAESMKKQGTAVRYLDRKAYGEFMKQNDAVNKELARDLGLLKR
jgi:tripartite-type tricarboxylate transporter receptor subunit TctC